MTKFKLDYRDVLESFLSDNKVHNQPLSPESISSVEAFAEKLRDHHTASQEMIAHNLDVLHAHLITHDGELDIKSLEEFLERDPPVRHS